MKGITLCPDGHLLSLTYQYFRTLVLVTTRNYCYALRVNF